MLYFEEWRTAGHYQSLEVDPNVDMNRVLAHFSWRTKCLSRSGSTLLSCSKYSTTVKAELPTLPTASLRRAETQFFLRYFLAGSESRYFTQINHFRYLI